MMSSATPAGTDAVRPLREVAFDEVFDSQRTFRVLLDVLSRPGRGFRLPGLEYRGTPPGMNPHCLTILKTLCDHQVSFAVIAGDSTRSWRQYLEVNLAMAAGEAAQADYLLFAGGSFHPEFLATRRGSLEFPEEGATVVLAVGEVLAARKDDPPAAESPTPRREAIPRCEETPCRLRLHGPGVDGTIEVSFRGLDRRYLEALGEINELFPLGIDCVFVDPEGVVTGIPRSTAVAVL